MRVDRHLYPLRSLLSDESLQLLFEWYLRHKTHVEKKGKKE